MRWKAVLIIGATYIFCHVVAKLPPKEDLCGMIVDAEVEQQCLTCFRKAGHISQNPEEVRNCTATYLPPDLAECSVPHVEKPGALRIHQGGGEYHNNHTNANFLPSCLRRRLRNLLIIRSEERFVRQASGGVQYIVESALVRHGGPTMLSIQALTSIMQLPEVKNLVEASASHCQEKYGKERQQPWERDLWEAKDEHDVVWEDMMEEEDEEGEMEDVYEMEEDSASMKGSARAAAGNNLPFEGTNSLARSVLLYECITSALFDSGAGAQLLEVVMQDGFFNPVPEWWVKPLLLIAKSAAQ